jgi:hypothetical protein
MSDHDFSDVWGTVHSIENYGIIVNVGRTSKDDQEFDLLKNGEKRISIQYVPFNNVAYIEYDIYN